MLRQSFASRILIGAVLAALAIPISGQAQGTDPQRARQFADRFLTLLDSGDVKPAYEMINPSVRANYPISSLTQAQNQRRTKGISRRTFVRMVSLPSSRTRLVGASTAVFCYSEPPATSFRTVSYTAVTVSSAANGTNYIDNFQTTSTPSAPCA